jgi:hypothetical protein
VGSKERKLRDNSMSLLLPEQWERYNCHLLTRDRLKKWQDSRWEESVDIRQAKVRCLLDIQMEMAKKLVLT